MIKSSPISNFIRAKLDENSLLYKEYCEEKRRHNQIRLTTIITICTKDLIHELVEFVPSARHAFPDLKIVVFTDDVNLAEEILKEYRITNICFKQIDLNDACYKITNVDNISQYWKKEPIWFKLKSLKDEVILANGEGVMLCDCDITFKRGFSRAFFGEVVLSPFYWGDRHLETREGDSLKDRDGEFNAGMIITNSVEFCDWWIESYENGLGGFYEQKCLDYAPKLFEVDYIGPEHNFGKWRFRVPKDHVSSFHYHVREKALNKINIFIKLEAQKAAAKARAMIKNK